MKLKNREGIETLAEKRESSIFSSKMLYAACWLCYAFTYLAKNNYSVAMSEMTTLGIIDASIAGLISSIFFICYAAGQLVSGFLADRYHPLGVIGVGVGIVVFSNAAMFTLYSPAPMLVVWWGLNGIGHSMLWPPTLYIISNILNPKVRFMAISLFTLATPVGKIGTYFMTGFALDRGNWTSVFKLAAASMGLIFIVLLGVYFSNRANLSEPQRSRHNKKGEECGKNDGAPDAKRIIGLFTLAGLFTVIPGIAVSGMLNYGASEWIPTILITRYGVSDSTAAYLTSLTPLAAIFVVVLTNTLYIKVFRSNEIKTALFMMSVSVLPIGMMIALVAVKKPIFGNTADAILFTVAFSLLMIAQMGVDHLIVSLVAMRFSSYSCVATVSGLLNSCKYVGSAISTYGMGMLMGNANVLAIVLVWLAATLVGAVFLLASTVKWKRFIAPIDNGENGENIEAIKE